MFTWHINSTAGEHDLYGDVPHEGPDLETGWGGGEQGEGVVEVQGVVVAQ